MLRRTPTPAPGGAAWAGRPETPEDRRSAVSWLRVLGTTAGRMVVMLVVSMALWSCAPAVFGWKITTVVTGSMEPSIAVGDVVAAVPVGFQDLTRGRVVLVNDPDHAGRLRLHRIAAVNPDGSLTLRGDANAADDSSRVWPSAVQGIGYLRIPAAGLPGVWIGSGQWLKLSALGGVLAGALALTRLDRPLPRGRRDGTTAGDRPGTPARHTAGGMRHLVPTGRALSVLLIVSVTACMATAAVLVAPAAYAAFSAKSTNTGNTFAARPYFSCTAAVMADSPTLFFAFNNTPSPATTVTDSSGSGSNGTFQSTSSLSAAIPCSGDSGKSANLAGTRYISTSGSAATGPTVFSYELWFKTTSTAGGKLAGFQDSQTATTGTNDRNLYMRADGVLVFGVAPGGVMQTVASPAAYNDGVWHHTAVTLSAAGMKLYVDGARVATASGITTAQAGYTGWWRFGDGTLTGWPGAAGTAFNGQVDNIAVYNTAALTAAKILAHFQAGAP